MLPHKGRSSISSTEFQVHPTKFKAWGVLWFHDSIFILWVLTKWPLHCQSPAVSTRRGYRFVPCDTPHQRGSVQFVQEYLWYELNGRKSLKPALGLMGVVNFSNMLIQQHVQCAEQETVKMPRLCGHHGLLSSRRTWQVISWIGSFKCFNCTEWSGSSPPCSCYYSFTSSEDPPQTLWERSPGRVPVDLPPAPVNVR